MLASPDAHTKIGEILPPAKFHKPEEKVFRICK